jgi:hypothetical protein
LLQERIKGYRERYGDGQHLGNEWEYARIEAYSMRPNAQLRYRIRNNLRWNIIPLRHGYQIPEDGNLFSMTDKHNKHHPKVEPACIGMHVRHGDSSNDARGQTKLNRTLEAHVDCAKDFMIALGVGNIYLATDDIDVLSTVNRLYPQYNWYALRRHLKKFTGASFEGYHNEKSAQGELANLMVRVSVNTTLLCP